MEQCKAVCHLGGVIPHIANSYLSSTPSEGDAIGQPGHLFKNPANEKDLHDMSDTEVAGWVEADVNELTSLKEREVCIPVKRPKGVNIVKSGWTRNYKQNEKGNTLKRKSRCYACGYVAKWKD